MQYKKFQQVNLRSITCFPRLLILPRLTNYSSCFLVSFECLIQGSLLNFKYQPNFVNKSFIYILDNHIILFFQVSSLKLLYAAILYLFLLNGITQNLLLILGKIVLIAECRTLSYTKHQTVSFRKTDVFKIRKIQSMFKSARYIMNFSLTIYIDKGFSEIYFLDVCSMIFNNISVIRTCFFY